MNAVKKTTPTMMISPGSITRALKLSEFDVQAAHSSMSPSPRPLMRQAGRPGAARIGAVLAVLYEKFNAPHILLIRRSTALTYHPGQISFPGGRHENGEDLRDTALRETFEEVGLHENCLTVLGPLAPVYISPSDFIVHPFVAWHRGLPACSINKDEVDEIMETPLGLFLEPSTGCTEIRIKDNRELTVPFYRLGSDKLWGATAMMLAELLQRLAACDDLN